MSRTLIFHVTVPDDFDADNVPEVEEAIQQAMAELNGDQLGEHWADDDYDASFRGEA